MIEAQEQALNHMSPYSFWQPSHYSAINSESRQNNFDPYLQENILNNPAYVYPNQGHKLGSSLQYTGDLRRTGRQAGVDMSSSQFSCTELSVSDMELGNFSENSRPEKRSSSVAYCPLIGVESHLTDHNQAWIPHRTETLRSTNQDLHYAAQDSHYGFSTTDASSFIEHPCNYENSEDSIQEPCPERRDNIEPLEAEATAEVKSHAHDCNLRIFRQSGKLHLQGIISAARSDRCKHIDLTFSRTLSFESITRIPWTSFEKQDCRRVVRIERIQAGPEIELSFLVVVPKIAFDTPHARQDANYVEISCLRCLHGDSGKVEYLITSVEVIRIVELIIGIGEKSQQIRREERGRIRSNLVPLWHKGFTNTEGPNIEHSRQKFLNILRNYQIRKPYNISKLMRLLSWENLLFALRRAIEFYRVLIPNSED